MTECSEKTSCFERFAVLETNQQNMAKQNDRIIGKLDEIIPSVRENSWWIEKIKWGFVMIAVAGFALGIVSWIKK